MTESEKLERAKDYINKLANGIDPLTDSELPQDTVLNNVRLSRCFFYVSEVIQREMDRQKRSSSSKKEIFRLSGEQIASAQLAPSPITISDFADYLNSFINMEIMTKLQPTKITNWLLENGYLEIQTDDKNKSRRLPTPRRRKNRNHRYRKRRAVRQILYQHVRQKRSAVYSRQHKQNIELSDNRY